MLKVTVNTSNRGAVMKQPTKTFSHRPLTGKVLRQENRKFSGTCVFRTKVDSDSGANWTLIPAETGQ